MIYLMFFVLLILIYILFNTSYANKRKVELLKADFDSLKKNYEDLKEKLTENKLLTEKMKSNLEDYKKEISKKLDLVQNEVNEIEEEITGSNI